MEQYIYKRKSDGIYIINLKRTWEKLLLAAIVPLQLLLPLRTLLMSASSPLGTLGSELC
ncbi:40S ribosomal protein SA [Lemmus lemmus]